MDKLEKAENGYKGVISVGDFGMDTFDLVNEEQSENKCSIFLTLDTSQSDRFNSIKL